MRAKPVATSGARGASRRAASVREWPGPTAGKDSISADDLEDETAAGAGQGAGRGAGSQGDSGLGRDPVGQGLDSAGKGVSCAGCLCGACAS